MIVFFIPKWFWIELEGQKILFNRKCFWSEKERICSKTLPSFLLLPDMYVLSFAGLFFLLSWLFFYIRLAFKRQSSIFFLWKWNRTWSSLVITPDLLHLGGQNYSWHNQIDFNCPLVQLQCIQLQTTKRQFSTTIDIGWGFCKGHSAIFVAHLFYNLCHFQEKSCF